MKYIIMAFYSVLSLIKECHDNGILDFLGLIFSTTIPIVIMNKTIKYEKVAAKQDANERERQYQESIKIAEQRHKEQLKAQEDINRVAIMPYLTIENISTQIRNDRIEFIILFKNIGNGTAINLTAKYSKSEMYFSSVYENDLVAYCCTEPFDVHNATVRPDEICQLTISQVLKSTTKYNYDKVEFTIKYADMKQQPYEQPFTIIFDDSNLNDIKITRKIINNPIPK